MPDLKIVYNEYAATYERMVACEDYEGRLLPAIRAIHTLSGADVVECGAGTGRVTRLIAPHVHGVRAFDLSAGMLRVGAERMREGQHTNVSLAVADSRALPLPDACADLAIEGWSLLQIAMWHQAAWRTEAGRAVDEALRVLRPGGTAILIETLGTSATEPNPQNPWFRTFYDYLEQERGFQATWVRTDYAFAHRDEAAQMMRFFFGDELVPSILRSAIDTADGRCMVPECTGLWWRIR